MDLSQFWPYSKCFNFANTRCFLEPFLALHNANVVVQLFFAPFWHFYFLTQTDHFAWAIAHASWPILAIFKMLSFLNTICFLERFFHTATIYIMVVQSFLAPF